MIKKGLSRLGTFFLYLVSLLPFWILYLISDILFVILYHITRYRRKVVKENLANSFPKKTEAERNTIERKYYKYMADLMVETIKSVSISAKEVQLRMKVTNPELIDYYFNQGKSIIAAAGHYCNWEMATLSFGFLTDHRRVIVYKPQSNVVFTDFFNKTRSRFGATMISMKQTLRKFIEFKNELSFNVLVSDQTPTREDAKYFTTFLNQPTAVFLGIEKLTKVINCSVIFYRIDLVKRGYYTFTFVPLIDEPQNTQPYEITEAHVRYLENLIIEKPEFWLWSHRRWKIKPEDVKK
ncbi:KDO2-lipid IV(A) lauroyltransferase [Mucilaginibacter frigoritolerans]|uniref:KDO2-lipid IV(A) lauroyltransferase n=1 Tax=Mucilaginibacter frigoritolerans TaxID=652788 RepID=A0A562TZ41_9SPHI|nr:lysophospholipid acyltransferase family protein [Mucilaginibacter frigoritolerans]TWI98050.1 KDO2-lipid IV(A) lauroyltransferase [Mucilaginibacter frigoritolerans]